MATIPSGTGTITLAFPEQDEKPQIWEIGRPSVGPKDVGITITHCGICHSDAHAAKGDWNSLGVTFPLVTGHEIAGVVKEVGSEVDSTKFKVGDIVGVGCMVESCRTCPSCKVSKEQFCDEGILMVYGSKFPGPDKYPKNYDDAVGHQTSGGYSDYIVLNEDFVYSVPDNMKPEYACILFCAGVTMYSPLKQYVLQQSQIDGIPMDEKKVGIIGFGGLGHLAVMIGIAMGLKPENITIFAHVANEGKKKQAAEMGVTSYVGLSDEDAIKALNRKYDCIMDTQPVAHVIDTFVDMIKVGGYFVLIGVHSGSYQLQAQQMIFNEQKVVGSMIGGIKETREMLDFCSKHNIVPEYKIIHAKDAYEHQQKLVKGDVLDQAYRAVIDIATLKEMDNESMNGGPTKRLKLS